MKENIRFRGLTLNKDEQSAAHGELALCAGVEMHDGALRSSVLQGSMVQHDESGTAVDSVLQVTIEDHDYVTTLLYVHETSTYRHFIGVYGNKLYWFDYDGTVGSPWAQSVSPTRTPIKDFGNSENIISVTSNGNTLIVMTDKAVHYILWKDTDYKYLGTQFPLLEICFRPDEGHKASYDRSSVTEDENNDPDAKSDSAWRAMEYDPREIFPLKESQYFHKDNADYILVNSDKQAEVTEAVHALINQANNTIAKDGHFYAPFMIRYCYRLYDGSMVMHSAPLFMDVTTPFAYKVYAQNLSTWEYPAESIANTAIGLTVALHIEDDSNNEFSSNKALFRYFPSNVGINYQIADATTISELKDDWSDIIKSVDIFVTPPIVREDFSEKIMRVKRQDDMYGVRDDALQQLYSIYKQSTTIKEIAPDYYASVKFTLNIVFDIPMLSDEAYLTKIRDTSNFYKIASINVDDLAVTQNSSNVVIYKALDYDKSAIENISVQEQMKDDYHTHHQLMPIVGKNNGMYMYNHRLNLYGFKERLFEGFSLASMVNEVTVDGMSPSLTIKKIIVELATNEGKKYVKKEFNGQFSQYTLANSVLFYPDERAVKMWLCNDSYVIVTMKMEPHNFLNGAIATDKFYETYITPEYGAIPSGPFTSPNNEVQMPNKVITSEVDNPYYFPLEGRNTVGLGAIIGMAAVTRALSQGQVGDHDLIVFATDGIWVMKVASTGTYSAMHNISREVCTNPKSICQLDQSVTFATERALSRFVESDIVPMSEELDGPIPKWINNSTTPPSDGLLPGLYTAFSSNAAISRLLAFGTPAVDMFNQGKVLYDHAGMRVIVLPASTAQESVALVWSTRDRTWSTMNIPALKAVVAGYPYPFVQLGGSGQDGKVMILDKAYNYSNANDSTVPAMVITRTLTFSDTMDVLRGFRQLTDCGTPPVMFFYGSNDQRNWKYIGSTSRMFYEYLPGHPFRWFRIAIFMQMKPSEEYQQLELEIINKYAKL